MKNNVEIKGANEFEINFAEVKKYGQTDPYRIQIPAWLGKRLANKTLKVTIEVQE